MSNQSPKILVQIKNFIQECLRRSLRWIMQKLSSKDSMTDNGPSEKKDIICDTNIWYSIGNGVISPESIDENYRLIATFNSIDEFSKTDMLLSGPEYTRNGVQAMLKYSNRHAIYQPPLIYLKQLDDPTFQYNIAVELGPILTMTQRIANGFVIKEEFAEEYARIVQQKRIGLQAATDQINSMAAKLKERIKDRKKHRDEDTRLLNRQFISQLVAVQTKTSGLSDQFDWSKIELFENVLKVLFNELETGAKIFKRNDWYDLFNLIYVSPEKKYWTKDGAWKRYIEKARMSKYLFESGKIGTS